jgi:hypothetical protein
LNQNKNKLSNEDFNRYTKQYECINRIVQIYDTQGNNAFEEVVQLVNEVLFSLSLSLDSEMN